MDHQINTARLQRMKNTQSKRKEIKTGTELGTIYCLGLKDCTHNAKSQEIKITKNNLEKNNCIICPSTFLAKIFAQGKINAVKLDKTSKM